MIMGQRACPGSCFNMWWWSLASSVLAGGDPGPACWPGIMLQYVHFSFSLSPSRFLSLFLSIIIWINFIIFSLQIIIIKRSRGNGRWSWICIFSGLGLLCIIWVIVCQNRAMWWCVLSGDGGRPEAASFPINLVDLEFISLSSTGRVGYIPLEIGCWYYVLFYCTKLVRCDA